MSYKDAVVFAIVGTDFMELPTQTPLNSGHKFCEMVLEHTIAVSGFVAILLLY
jgi:hypothetical protein